MPPEVTERNATVAPGLGIVGLEFDGSLVAGQGLFVPPEVTERIATVAPGLGIVRINCQ